MGHLVNPVTFRLSKSKFWVSNWSFYNKKNYQKYFLEDYNNFNIFKWLLSLVNYKEIGFKFLDINFIKSFKTFILNISLIFEDDYIIDVLKNDDIIYKQFLYDWSIAKLNSKKKKSIYKVGNKKKLYNLYLNTKKKRQRYNEISTKFFITYKYKNNFFYLENKNIMKFLFFKKFFYIYGKNVIKRFKKYKFYVYKGKKLIGYRKYKKYYTLNIKKRKNNFLKNNNYFQINKLRKFDILNYYSKKKFINKFFFYKDFKYFNLLLKNLKFLKLKNNLFFLEKNYIPVKNILLFFKRYLEYFLKNIFKIKKLYINFFEKFSYRLSSKFIKRFLKFEIYKKGYRVNHIINLIRKDLIMDVSILGFKLGYFGRYQKRLRNKDFYKIRGSLAPSNINSVVSYENFVVLLRQGIAGIELSIIKKMKKNEIF